MSNSPNNLPMIARWVLSLAALVAICLSIGYYVTTGDGIAHTAGVMLVIISSILIFAASTVVLLDRKQRRWLRVVLDILMYLGVIGTALAAYMLEAHWLLATMAVAFIALIVSDIAGPGDRQISNTKMQEAVQ